MIWKKSRGENAPLKEQRGRYTRYWKGNIENKFPKACYY